ncbi:N-acetyltransferase [Oricola sp.]|uniref:N-acetyltransferase n=1 Tax=Oricola sp. TaxID=1979950 RepID=UPI003BA89F67
MTSRYVYDDPDRMIAWAEARLPDVHFGEDPKAIGHERNGQIVGVCLYTHPTGRSCMFHAVSDGSRRWVTREFITRAMAYPFIQCGYHRMTCTVSLDNPDSLLFTVHFGWTLEGVMREEGPNGEDMLLFGLLARECRQISHLRLAGISGREAI